MTVGNKACSSAGQCDCCAASKAEQEMTMDGAVARLIARQAIDDCVSRYMRGQDRLDGDLQKSAFHTDATVDYGFYRGRADNFVDFAQTLLTAYTATHHLIGQTLISIANNEADGEIYFTAYHRRLGAHGPEDLIIAGRYIDRYTFQDGRWAIIERMELIDWSRTDPAADDWFDRTPDALRGQRNGGDASYKYNLIQGRTEQEPNNPKGWKAS